MTSHFTSARARRYLLGAESEEESVALEREYFEDPDALERVTAAEDDLIEDYLGERLDGADRERFERIYLSTPEHRVRVATIRRLMAHGSRATPAVSPPKATVVAGRFTRYRPWLALAASLFVVASAGIWFYSLYARNPAKIAEQPRTQPLTPAPPEVRPSIPPRVFALSVSPLGVRDGSNTPPAIIPAGTDIVVLCLEPEAEPRALTPVRGSIRTVAGRGQWQGPVAARSVRPAGTVACLDVPAARLPPDDYLLTLYGTDRRGAEQEWTQYFLRVRAR